MLNSSPVIRTLDLQVDSIECMGLDHGSESGTGRVQRLQYARAQFRIYEVLVLYSLGSHDFCFTLGSKKLEHGCSRIDVCWFSFFLWFGLEDGHSPALWLLLQGRHGLIIRLVNLGEFRVLALAPWF